MSHMNRFVVGHQRHLCSQPLTETPVCVHILALMHLFILICGHFFMAWHISHRCSAAICVCSMGCACSGYNSCTDVAVLWQNPALMCAQQEWIVHTAPDESCSVSWYKQEGLPCTWGSALPYILCFSSGWVLTLRGQVQDFQLEETEEQAGNRGKKVSQNNPSSPPLPVLCRMVLTTCYTTSEQGRVSSSLVLNVPSCPHTQIVILI